MDLEKGFLGGFLVLGVTIFVAGFLAGMLFLGTIHVSSDAATLGLVSFVLGLITGMLTIALVLVVMKIREIPRAS
jgi:Na+-transporting NADH:ubiquinone oxidoreductase subunit NqrB